MQGVKHERLDSLLLAGVGTLAVHEIAYVPGSVRASVAGGVSHSHIPLLWGVGGTLAVAALVRYVAASLRSRVGGRVVDPTWLGLTMAALYVSQEAAERALAGNPAISLLTNPVLWIGLVAVPLVAFALARLVECVVDVLGAAADSRRMFVSLSPPLRPASAGAPTLLRLAHSVGTRGPPRRIAI